ncbi:hypothetical protein AAVH_19482 [Aphelenchoides avenae]|nr:hypothetical protein AAVH_19482 [Aphelenchus avenae]
MKAFLGTLLLVLIVLYTVSATCKDSDGKEFPKECQRCSGPEGLWVLTCKGGSWQKKPCKDDLICKQKKKCKARCEA